MGRSSFLSRRNLELTVACYVHLIVRITAYRESDKLILDKINFAPHKAEQIEQLHERVANRLRWVIDVNQGLYLKLGQALGKSFGEQGCLP